VNSTVMGLSGRSYAIGCDVEISEVKFIILLQFASMLRKSDKWLHESRLNNGIVPPV
jgi:hypothetical protein